MNIFIINIVALLSGIIASMGLGGGTVLIIYLALFTSLSQIQCQGINLIFFIPIALLAVIIHSKNKLIEWKKIVPAIITGTIGVFIGSFLAFSINPQYLKKAFAVFILFIGIKELFTKKNQT